MTNVYAAVLDMSPTLEGDELETASAELAVDRAAISKCSVKKIPLINVAASLV